jgi:mono/diheme cytochrome c family protein
MNKWGAGACALAAMLFIATAVSAQGDQIAQGGKLYAANCAVCHGDKGEGRVGARLKDFPSINPAALVKATVANGIPGGKMPAWAKSKGGPLSDADIDAIAAYVASWTTGGAPAPTEAPKPIAPLPTVAGVAGDPTRGALVFQQNCAVCHGVKGEGRVGANLSKPFASAFPAAFVKQAVSNGVPASVMPAWAKANGGPLTDQQVDDVTAYVLAQQKTNAPTFIEPTAMPAPVLGGGASTLVVLVVLAVVIAVIVFFSAREASKS